MDRVPGAVLLLPGGQLVPVRIESGGRVVFLPDPLTPEEATELLTGAIQSLQLATGRVGLQLAIDGVPRHAAHGDGGHASLRAALHAPDTYEDREFWSADDGKPQYVPSRLEEVRLGFRALSPGEIFNPWSPLK